MVSMEMGKGSRREGDGRDDPIGSDDSINYLESISVDDSKELSRIVNAIAEEHGCEILSYCIYGSKVSGYARPDSDYDILLVLKDYKEIIKYVYVRDDYRLNASVLVVDGKALLRDAEHAMLGEFVAGRLLHPYLPLYNGSYLNDVETLYKKRVIVEEYSTLMGLNPLVATDEVAIPLEYFLFSKIKKRARIYPHALYSYVKTYTGSHAARNMEISRRGFMRALRELEKEGRIELKVHKDGDDGNYYHIMLKDKCKGNHRALMKEMFRGAFAWLVHSYAARRTLNFFKEEAASKLKRRKEVKAYSIPPALDTPTILLKVNEGIVVDGDSWLDMIAEALGFRDGYSARFTSIGDKHAATSLCTLEHEEGMEGGKATKKKESIVIKYYTNVKMAKWIALNVWLAGIRHYDVSPEKRMMNEYIGVRRVRALGINTPEVVAVSFGKRLMAFKYVDGIPLSSMIDALVGDHNHNHNHSHGNDHAQAGRVNRMEGEEGLLSHVKRYGALLGMIHANGFILRDTKPSNVLVVPLPPYNADDYSDGSTAIAKTSSDMLYITDFEQFSTSTDYDDMAWDIACFLYYSLLFKRDEDMARMFVRAFLEGYAQHGSSDAIARAAKSSYFLPFYPAMVIGIIKAVREEIRSFRC